MACQCQSKKKSWAGHESARTDGWMDGQTECILVDEQTNTKKNNYQQEVIIQTNVTKNLGQCKKTGSKSNLLYWVRRKLRRLKSFLI